MGRNLFATDQQAQQPAPAPGGEQQPKKGRNLFAPQPSSADFEKQVAGLTHEQIVDEYRKAEINSPYYNFLVKKIEAPQAGETPEQAALRAGGQKPAGAPSQSLSAFGGAAEQLSFGGADELGAGIDWLRGEDYDQSLAKHRRFRDELEETNPGSYLAGQIGGGVVQAAATLGASAPETFLGRLGMNVLGGASQGATYGALSEDGSIGDRLGSAASGAAWGAGFGLAPSVLEGGYKTLRGGVRAARNVGRQYLNPRGVAEDRLSRGLAQDYIDHGRLVRREQAAGAEAPLPDFLTVPEANALRAQGHRVQMSDFGGENMRRELKDASNISASASKRMRDAANARQEGQAGRVTSEISDLYGGEINPKHITDSLEEEGARWNKQNYDRAFNNPNGSHIWDQATQTILSSPYGERALKGAVDVMKTDALDAGVDFLEPVFQPNAVGRMEFMGFRALDGSMVQGHGLNLNFWNQFKIQIDQQIRGLRDGGFSAEARQLTSLKNKMLREIDHKLGDDSYAKARGDAKEIFDLVGKNGKGGALRAGADYLTKMDAIDTAEARAALEAMNPMERELFARGFSAELVNRISQMGDTEDVAKMFKSSQSRMKVVDALGEENAARIEALVHAEQAQGMLRKVINGGSDTAKNLLSAENLLHAAGQAAPAAGGAVAGYSTTGDMSGLLLGLAGGAGFRYVNRAAARRVADMMAEIALSEDPAVIKALLAKAAADPEYMAFSRAVSSAASSATGAAGRTAGGAAGNQRIDPRMPFADGGPVRLAGGNLVKKAAQAAGKLLKGAESKPPKNVTNLGRMAEGEPVMLNGKDVSQWSPGDWGTFGRSYGRNDVGPASDEEFLSSLVELPTLSGRTFTVPGGIDDVERPFTYYDLLHLKSQAVDPNDLPPDVHRRIHNRMVRTMQPGPEFDDVDRYNQLAFGMISPNQPLTPNELAMARVRAKTPEDIETMANFAPWNIGDDVSKTQRQELSRGISQYFGLQGKNKGGIGASGSADYSRIADMAKLMREKPEFYRFAGAAEGGADDAENWSNFVGRVAAQTPGLSYKTASLGTVWQDPVNAAISAIDRHMAGSFRGAMFDNQKDVNAFNRRVLQKFNKGRPRGQGAKNFDEMLEMPGGRGALVDELFVELNRRGKTKLRVAKTGELNPKAPEWARNADWIREPEKVDKMSAAYVRALRENDRIARENNQGLFANQWMVWDRIRERLEPHEIMHPAIRALPRMTLDQIKAANKAHSKAGYKAASGKARPANPSELAYFSVAPLGGLAALAAYQDEQGQ